MGQKKKNLKDRINTHVYVVKNCILAPFVHKYKALDIPFIYTQAFFRGQKLKKYNIISVREFCEAYEGERIVLEEPSERPVCIPEYFGQNNQKVEKEKSPEIYVAKLKNVNVIGGTNFLQKDNYIVSDILADDSENRIDMHFGVVRRNESKNVTIVTNQVASFVEEAISLLGFASSNYYHFTVEIISRLAYIDQFKQYRDTPILIDEDVKRYNQLIEILDLFKGEHPVKYVKKAEYINVEKLILPSMNTWMPINVKSQDLFEVSDNIIAQSAVDNVRRAAECYLNDSENRRIYLSRKNAKNARLTNAAEVEELFRDAGYEIVYTEELSYADQVRLFSSAKCIVGATGAALTNVIYCNPGTIIGCIIPRSYNFYIYSTLAYMVDCKPIFLDAEITVKTQYVSLGAYMVDEKTCIDYIKYLNEV